MEDRFIEINYKGAGKPYGGANSRDNYGGVILVNINNIAIDGPCVMIQGLSYFIETDERERIMNIINKAEELRLEK